MKDFKQLSLIPPLQRALSDQGYVTPTSIQAQAIPAAIEGHDLLGCAQTGTGKTAAFALPILNSLGRAQNPARPRPHAPAALILAPTRELVVQIGDAFRNYGKHLRLRVSLVYGGVSQRNQVRDMDRGTHILVATPGRLLDLMSQGYVKLETLKIFVLDEADRMLDMGFLPDLKRIMKVLPEERQSLFFSATLPPKIRNLAKQLLWEPTIVDVTPKTTSVEKIEQHVMLVKANEKQAVLTDLLASPDVDRVIVFTRTKRRANWVSEKLQRQGIQSAAIHGNKSQSARQKALDAFRDARIKVLVATDVAARGIDVDGVTHVVNFDVPNEPESYVHRIGRTGRAGASGIAISLCAPEEIAELKAIERLIGKQVPVVPRPATQRSSLQTTRRHSDPPSSKPAKPKSPTSKLKSQAAGSSRRTNSARRRRKSTKQVHMA